ncbi:dual OB domain-containing protein [Natrialbaceae archaeon A-CW3]
MVNTVEMVCLANSEKHGDRCVAGVRLDTGGWLRPVSDDTGAGLLETQYETVSGHHPKPLDTILVKLDRQRPKYHQPENWVISGEKWQLIDTELNDQALLAVNAALQREGFIFHNDSRAIPKRELKEMPVFRSLTLVSPKDPEFFVRETDRGTLQPRTTFEFDGHEYNLPITHPRWRQQARTGGIGSLPSAEIVEDNKEILFTISLGEADKNKMCYKIVAAVFSIDSTNLIGL